GQDDPFRGQSGPAFRYLDAFGPGSEETISASIASRPPAAGARPRLPRVAKKTAAVQVGTRSRPGTSSAAKDGRNAQCQPISRVNAAATSRSSPSFHGETTPGAKT